MVYNLINPNFKTFSMKKLIFSAVALIAFSAVSTANNVEEKKTETKEAKVKIAVEDEKETPQCYYGWIAVYETSGVEAADAWGRAHGC